jgi:WD40 repeat protein
VLTACACLLLAAPAPAQDNRSRREIATPGLVVETGARIGACDVVRFTADGKYLLAAGDDKVVRNWKLGPGGLEKSDLPILRWSSYRETRGNIYALDLSPEKGQPYVAVAGMSVYSAGFGVAVLDRRTGAVKFGLKPGDRDQLHVGSIWSVAFSPSGAQLAFGTDRGDVWLWHFRQKGPVAPRLLGHHARRAGQPGPFNLVKLVAFLDEERLVSAAESGEVRRWAVPAATGEVSSAVLVPAGGPRQARLALSPDHKLLAVAYEKNLVGVLSLAGGTSREIQLPAGPPVQYPHSLAFDADGQRLAVGVRLVDPTADFFREVGDRVLLYDLRQAELRPTEGPTPTFHAEAMAFHPTDGNLLAVAGGVNHEVTLWDLRTGAKRGEVVSPGSCLWGVALSPDLKGRYLAFQTRRDPEPQSPNRRGRGPWKYFDLQRRVWVADKAPFVPRGGLESVGGWKVHTRDPAAPPDRVRADTWFVEGPGSGGPIPLPWDRRNDLPRCYTLLPPVKGKPVRLAVGHYWGVSIFELSGKSVRRSRLLFGHDGEVMALAVSADGKKLVSVGRDQTVAGWSLEDWPYNPTLGAEFFPRQGKVVVGRVATGSPAWEAGLSPGDQIVLLAVSGTKVVFSRAPKIAPTAGDAETAAEALQQPEPNEQLYFAWQREGLKGLIQQFTSVIDRPLWRFFPTKQGEWVLWRWRDYYYDTSTKGDFDIGWQRSYDIGRTPDFYRAEQFRKQFLRPDKVQDTLTYWTGDQGETHFTQIEPPEVRLTVGGKPPAGEIAAAGDVEVTLTAGPHGRLDSKEPAGVVLDNQKPVRVLLWVNDYQLATWQPGPDDLDKNGVFRQTVKVPRGRLRVGLNLLTAQCYNKGDLRSEGPPVRVRFERRVPERSLYGLFVGVGDYQRSRPRQVSLRSAQDVEVLKKAWATQAGKGKLYEKARLEVLVNAQVTPAAVLTSLGGLEDQVGPDDLLVVQLGGHGVALADLKKAKVPAKRLRGLDSFLFCCGDFNLQRLDGTTIGFSKIYETLVKLPCHKLVLLDTCRSGKAKDLLAAAPSDPIRALTRDGIGPVILAACGPRESAQEEDTIDGGQAYGLFAVALRRTLEEPRYFARADKNGDHVLEAGELAGAVRDQVRGLVRRFREEGVAGIEDQNPTPFLPDLESGLALAVGERYRPAR